MWRREAVAAVLGLVVLQACGSTTDGGLAETYNDDRQSLIDMESRLDARSDTSLANMPETGSAIYEGYAGIVLDGIGGLNTSLVGDATIDADFDEGSISGRATDFRGTEAGLNGEDYDGSLILSDGDISGNDASGRLAGTLRSDSNVVTLDARMEGGFVGNPGVAGIELESVSGSGTLDGRPTSGSVGIFAEPR